jgi:FtsP/CotA-like multicopper oxidase with cupredoxin domain
MIRAIATACLLALVPAIALVACTQPGRSPEGSAATASHSTPAVSLPLAIPNDHRTAAGAWRDGRFELHLVAQPTRWTPENDPDGTVSVLAFAERGGPVQIPGPMVRIPQGTEVIVSVRNEIAEDSWIGLPTSRVRGAATRPIAGPELTVHGLPPGEPAETPLRISIGTERTVRFRADTPGTFLYWGAMSGIGLAERTAADAQLTGIIVVDHAGIVPDPAERIFVITMTDAFPDPSRSPSGEDVFKAVINGLSWPHTERLHHAVGDRIRWRWVNGSFSEHPMHLHGFHFRTLERGTRSGEIVHGEDETPDVVTELLEPGNSFRMEWTPTRAGNWLMHCHLVDHITPFPPRDPAARAHDAHDVEQHALDAMAGLVMGITIEDDGAAADDPAPQTRLWLVARERDSGGGRKIRGFAIGDGGEPVAVPESAPGPPLILTRGRTSTITVMNRMQEPTTVHWHGMELASVYDGVAGWSRTGSRIAPLVGPGESFTVSMTPPRAGTFIYHTHMDETDQIGSGLYGPLLVLDPQESHNPERDRIFVIGAGVHEDGYALAINGAVTLEPQFFRAGTEYRLRFINISPGATVNIEISRDAELIDWIALANDGADLPTALQTKQPARLRMSAGETYDFLWTPESSGEAVLAVQWPFPTDPGSLTRRQALRVR